MSRYCTSIQLSYSFLFTNKNDTTVTVFGMIKDMKQRYRINGKRFNLQELYQTPMGDRDVFKFTKSHLKLGKEFQGRSFDLLISHTTIVFSR
ncbi:MAG: family transposase, partial [Paenibacillus sp.]|nr:family transposase [Paenibacillus sp.]